MKTNSIFAIVLSLLAVPLAFADGEAKPIVDGIVKVENDQSKQKSETIATLEYRPASSMYAVRGRVQYRNVEGIAYLEMWNIMPDGRRYFSRTVDEYGPMRKIQGNSGWREFALPFNLMQHQPESVTLEINVVMPGKGTIEVSELTVSDIPSGVPMSDALPPVVDAPVVKQWFDGGTAGFYGGLAGGAVGIYGALFGCLAGFLVPRGKGRSLLIAMAALGFAVGIVSLLVGIFAVFSGQPYHVWYGFTLIGGLLVFILPVAFSTIGKQYEQFEQRRMQALDM